MTLPTLHRRHLGVLLLASAAAWGAHAQERFPAKPITIVVPQAAGGANDAIARVLGQKLSQQLGQSVVIDNRPGAGGNVGADAHLPGKPAPDKPRNGHRDGPDDDPQNAEAALSAREIADEVNAWRRRWASLCKWVSPVIS